VVDCTSARTFDVGLIDGVNAKSLNAHYASISADPPYFVPIAKSTATPLEQQQYISEWQVLQVPDHMHSKASGMDKYQPGL